MVKLTTMDLQEMLKLTSPFSIGIDDFFRRIDNVQRNNSQSYPPYNITKIDDEHFVIEIACAGFGKDNIDIESKKTNFLNSDKFLKKTLIKDR